MSEKISQINNQLDGTVYTGDHRQWFVQGNIQNRQAAENVANTNAMVSLDIRNLNATYNASVELIEGHFKDKGIKIDPVRVVERETLNRAYTLSRRSMDLNDGDQQGENVFGRSVVVQNKEMEAEFGESFILGIGLHEAAHSVFGDGYKIWETTELTPNNTSIGGVAVQGLIKADFRKNTAQKNIGVFWNEAFADLTRVRALRNMGRTHDIEKDSQPFSAGDGLEMVFSPNNAHVDRSSAIAIPAEFSMLAKTVSGKNMIASSAPNFAAFALELLDVRVPGIYDDFLASATDARRQAGAIKKIESIQPGLYRELSTLLYNEEDFMHGLTVVWHALQQSTALESKTA